VTIILLLRKADDTDKPDMWIEVAAYDYDSLGPYGQEGKAVDRYLNDPRFSDAQKRGRFLAIELPGLSAKEFDTSSDVNWSFTDAPERTAEDLTLAPNDGD
jgi:hypothetical protein